MNFAEALRSSGIDARDARILLAAATGFSEASVLAFPEKALAPETEARALDFFHAADAASRSLTSSAGKSSTGSSSP